MRRKAPQYVGGSEISHSERDTGTARRSTWCCRSIENAAPRDQGSATMQPYGLCKFIYKQKHGFLSTTATTSRLLPKLISVVDFFLRRSKVSPHFWNCYVADNLNYKRSLNSHERACYFCTKEHTALIKGTCPTNYVSYARLKRKRNETLQMTFLFSFKFFFLISCYATEAKTWKEPLLTFSMQQL